MKSIFRKNKKLIILTIVVLVIALGGFLYQTHQDGFWNTNRLVAQCNIFRLKKSLVGNPNNTNLLLELGVNYYIVRDLNKASDIYIKITELNPDDFMAWNNLGNVFRDLVNFWDAKDAYKKALEINPNYIPAYINLVDLYTIWPMDEEGDKIREEITSILQQGLKLNPENETLQATLKAYVSATK